MAREIELKTDKYFTKSKNVVKQNGDVWVVYAVFMGTDVVSALQPVLNLLENYTSEYRVSPQDGPDGIVKAKEPIAYIEGWYSELSELETIILQMIGFSSVCAYNAYRMVRALPNVAFMDMAARHLPNADTHRQAAVGANIGSQLAFLENFNAKGFIGSSTDDTAPVYGKKEGMGTVPHALIGYAGSTLEAMKIYVEANPDDEMVVALVDYYGQEVTDTLEIVDWFYNQYEGHKKGKTLGIRLDTHGDRYLEGLTQFGSIEVLKEWMDEHDAPTDKNMIGKGVSAAAVIHLYNQLPDYAKDEVKIIASSGFDYEKCEDFAKVNTPVDMIGTGSFLPKTMKETFATSDIIKYGDRYSVKEGREWLVEKYKEKKNE